MSLSRFLEYFTQEDADRAVQELHGRELLGNTVTLSSYVNPTSLLHVCDRVIMWGVLIAGS